MFHKNILSLEETKNIVFSSKWVKSEIDKLVKKRMDELNKSKTMD